MRQGASIIVVSMMVYALIMFTFAWVIPTQASLYLRIGVSCVAFWMCLSALLIHLKDLSEKAVRP